MGACRHDDGVGLLLARRFLSQDFDQLVAGEVAQIVERLDRSIGFCGFAELDQHGGRQTLDGGNLVADPHLRTLGVELTLLLFEPGFGACAQLLGHFLVEALDVDQVLDRHIGDLLHRREALGDQKVGNDVVDVERLDEELRAVVELLLTAGALFLFGQDVDIPTGQLRGEADVLAAPADGQRQLLVGNHHLDPALLFVEHHLGDLGRCQGVDHEGCRFRRPGDDVDLFALQLRDHGLHAAAAHADAGPDRIDRVVVADHCDLGAAARVAGDRLDLDDTVVDLRNLLREELLHEVSARAGQEDLRATRLAAHVVDEGTHPVAGSYGLARQGFVAAHQTFGAAEVDGDVAELVALDDAVDDLADAVLVLLVLAAAFGVAHALHDHLLCCLGRDPAKIDRRQLVDQFVPELGLGLAQAGVIRRDLGELVLHRIGDRQIAAQFDLAGSAIHLGANVVLVAVLGPARLLDRLLHGDDHFVRFNSFFARNRFGHLQQFGAIGRRGVHRFSSSVLRSPTGSALSSSATPRS